MSRFSLLLTACIAIGLFAIASVGRGEDFEKMFLAVDSTPDFMAIGEKQAEETFFVSTEQDFDAVARVPVQEPKVIAPPPSHDEVQKPVQTVTYVSEGRRGLFRGRVLSRVLAGGPVRRVLAGAPGRRVFGFVFRRGRGGC